MQNTGESQSFPPYNIEKSDDNHYRITLALAGFRQEDLDIQLEGTRLTVKGTPQQPEKETKWLHQGQDAGSAAIARKKHSAISNRCEEKQ